MKTNFYYNTDPDGKMPTLSYGKPIKVCYIKYINDKPVLVAPYEGQASVWDYSTNTMISIDKLKVAPCPSK